MVRDREADDDGGDWADEKAFACMFHADWDQQKDEIAQALRDERKMEWLEGPPTEPGNYWWTWMHRPGTLRMCQVFLFDGLLVIDHGDGPTTVRQPLRYWFGPLPTPDGIPLPEPRTKGWDE